LVNADEAALKHKQAIKDSQTLIKKYEGQQSKVKNNREYEAIIKEIEYQTLEIQLSEKRIKENKFDIQNKKTVLDSSREVLEQKKQELETKKAELNSIIEETKKEEAVLEKTSGEAAKLIEDRLFQAYKKVRDNARNGLAVVAIQRDSCGGCFNKIPPQRQLDIRQHKKVIVCEHCGRILVDSKIVEN
jgi:predicted  nucleic acid-binding Zn-ribbon protein